MKTKELIQRLRDKDDQLCFLAEVEREKLLRRYEELGRSYDAMSNDLLCLFEELPVVPEENPVFLRDREDDAPVRSVEHVVEKGSGMNGKGGLLRQFIRKRIEKLTSSLRSRMTKTSILRCTISWNSVLSACCYMRNDCKYLFQIFDRSSIKRLCLIPGKNKFLATAGKIDIDENAVSHLRKGSMI